jgi:hypothetical protein
MMTKEETIEIIEEAVEAIKISPDYGSTKLYAKRWVSDRPNEHYDANIGQRFSFRWVEDPNSFSYIWAVYHDPEIEVICKKPTC